MLAAAAAIPHPPLLVWNVTASSPRGLYLVVPWQEPWRGSFVAVLVPSKAAALAAERRYIPAHVPLIKTVAAMRGDRVCDRGRTLLVNGRFAAWQLKRDGQGRRLEPWRGCRTLGLGELLVLGLGDPHSYDSRYFGPVAADRIIGPAYPVWPG